MIEKLKKVSKKEREAINTLKRLIKETKDGVLPGLDIMPNKRKLHSAFSSVTQKKGSNEFYNYKLEQNK